MRRLIVKHPVGFVGIVIILLYAVAAIFAPLLAPFEPDHFTLRSRLKPPAGFAGALPQHPLGTDIIGQDLLSRLLYGARVSLLVGLMAVAISLLVGTLLGCLAGYYGGRFDRVVSRFADLLMAFPYLLFTILMMGVLGPGFLNLMLALSFKAWVEFFRLARGETLAERQREYVTAARAMGGSDLRIIFGHILPNITHTLLVMATLRIGHMMILESSLSFLGLGVPPSVPAWGSMVAVGRERLLDAWWVSTVPGLAIVMLVMAINAVGESLRDWLDPRVQ